MAESKATIKIDVVVHDKLRVLKAEKRMKTISDVIYYLIREVNSGK